MTKKKINIKILILLFFSGVCGLIYEVIWMRMFVTVFGSTVYAVSTVLTAYMAGLALGSFYFGRFVDKHKDALRIFAYLNLALGICGLLFPLLFSNLDDIYVVIYKYFHISNYLFTSVRFVLSFIILIIPTTLIGATLPVISKFFVEDMNRLGRNIGKLYSINTFGAVVGCFITGFFLISSAGINASLWIAAFMNLLIAGFVLILSNKLKTAKIECRDEKTLIFNKEKEKNEKNYMSKHTENINLVVLYCFALSGFASLAYEVVWVRILIMFLHNNVYAFSTVLTTFLCGLFIGSYIFSKFIDNRKNLLFLFGCMEVTIGLSTIASILIFFILQNSMRILPAGFVGSWWWITGRQFIASFLLIVIPTILIGGTFPLVSKIYTKSPKILGRSIGNIYSINTVGSIFGSLIAGFVLIPLIGLWKSIICIALINVAIGGLIISLNTFTKRKYKRIALTVVLLIGGVMVASLSGDFFAGRASSALYYKESGTATISVFEEKIEGEIGKKVLHINHLRVVDDSYEALQLVRMLGNLPLLLHPDPKRVLVIGFGIGVTAWSVAQHNVEEIDCIEIVPGVIPATKYFSEVNHNLLYDLDGNLPKASDDRVKLIIDDGRSYVLTTEKKYDIITCDPIHPAFGSANLYSKECYELYKKKLSDNGVVAQFLPPHQLSMNDFKMVINTFREVFPHTTIWFTVEPYLILVGTTEKINIDFLSLKEKIEAEKVNNDLKLSNLGNPFALLSCLLLDEDSLDTFLDGMVKINTDDHPYLDFSMSRSYGIDTRGSNLLSIMEYRTDNIFSILSNFGENEEEISATKAEMKRYFKSKEYIINARLFSLKRMVREEILWYGRALKMNPDDKEADYLLEKALSKIYRISPL